MRLWRDRLKSKSGGSGNGTTYEGLEEKWKVARGESVEGLRGRGQERGEDGVSVLEGVMNDVDEEVGVGYLVEKCPSRGSLVVESGPLLSDGEGFVLPGDERDAVGDEEKRDESASRKEDLMKGRRGDERLDDAMRGKKRRDEVSQMIIRQRDRKTK